MARPTKYSDNILALSKSYLAQFYDKEYEALQAKEHKDEVIPSVEGLSQYIKIARSTIYEWQKDEDKCQFSDILEQIQVRQGQILINMGLTGKFNPQITKLVLGKHGYSEKADTTLSNKEGESFKTDSTFNFIPVKNKD